MTLDKALATIGDAINAHVPGEYHYLFDQTNDGTWMDWSLSLENESSVGAHVLPLLKLASSLASSMPDADEGFLADLWDGVANQCLIWAFG